MAPLSSKTVSWETPPARLPDPASRPVSTPPHGSWTPNVNSVAPSGMTTAWSLNVEDPSMAKALFGHVGMSADYRLVSDNRRLRARVRDRETELARVRAANEALMSQVSVSDELLLSLPAEPALT